ncbi:MAG: hypothetical protein ACTSX2_04010 [Candidatus Thorarchaeota archaeon]
MTDKSYWEPVLADADYAEHLREDYADDANMGDDEILFKYCDGKKYVTLWDHLGDAYTDYLPLADAYLKQKDYVASLEKRLTIDTLNPNRRIHIVDLVQHIFELEEKVKHERYQHYETCDSEGLGWDGEIPEKPKDY